MSAPARARSLRPRDLLVVSGVAGVVLGAAFWSLPVGLALAAGAVLALGLACFRRLRQGQVAIVSALEDSQRRHYRQTEALFSLFALIRPRAPVPALRDWAVSPDFAVLLVNEIRARRPGLVVELGSGASTVLIGYTLEGLGGGRVVSLDHDAVYARRTEALIAAHGLETVAAVRSAPLAPLDVDGEAFSWYAREAYIGLGPIDLLVVDGPPGALGRQARYPAFPALRLLLAPNAVIVVDDGVRADEATIVKRWQALDPRLTTEYVPTEKGAYVLRRSSVE